MKTFLLSLIFCILCLFSNAQDFIWAKSMGGSGSERGYGIATDVNGNIYTTGYFNSSVDFDPGVGTNIISCVGGTDGFITKLDANGNLVWALSLAGTGTLSIYAPPAIDNSGNLYITGNFSGVVDFDPSLSTYTATGTNDIFILKLTATGSFVWAKNIGGSSFESARRIITDASNNIYLAGMYTGIVDFDPSAATYTLSSNSSSTDGFILKLDPSGNFIWVNGIGGVGTDICASIALDVSNNLYATGSYSATVDFDPSAATYNLNSSGDYDIFILKLDANGNFILAKSTGGLGTDVSNSLVIDNNNDIFISGNFSATSDFDPSLSTFTLTSAGNTDLFISKLDGAGNFIWAKGIGSIGSDSGYSISLDALNNVYTTGQFNNTVDFDPSPSVYNLTSVGGDDIFISKLDANGNFIWARNIGSSGSDIGESIALDASNNIYTTGYYSGTADFDPNLSSYTLTSAGGNDIFVSKLSQPDITAPTTMATSVGLWKTANFTETFTDADNVGGSGIGKSFYQVSDFNGTEWRANGNRGFFYDDFNLPSLSADWTSAVGTWSVNTNTLEQSDELNANTNIYAAVSQTLANRYLYTFKGTINGTGSNRRAGIYIMCDDPTQTDRGNNYFIWIRPDDSKIQLYKTTTNTLTLVSDIVYSISVGTTYDYKISYDRITGELKLWVNNSFVASWTDVAPFSSGSAVSFRSGNSKFSIDDFAIYRSRSTSASILVGSGNTNDIRYQNPNPAQNSAKVKSIVTDLANNISSVATDNINVDWSIPNNILSINDGKNADINTVVTSDSLSANWTSSKDINSAISKYWYSIGTTPGATNTLTWTATTNGTDTLITAKSLTLTVGQVYYFNVKSEDGAGLMSTVISTNGQTVTPACTVPSLTITGGGNFCPAQTKTLTASGTASTYSWMPGGATTSSIVVSPTITTVYTLTASNGGTCTSTYTVQLTANSNPILSTNASPSTVCAGASSNLTAGGATTYTWSNGAFTSTTVVTPSVTTAYTLTGRSVVGCTSTKTIAVTVNATPTISPVNTGTICAGQSNTITAFGASTYTWNTGQTTNSIVVTPTTTTSYSVTGTSAQGCVSTFTSVNTVSVNTGPTVAVNSGGICLGGSYTLTASGATSYTWNTGANSFSIVVSPTATASYSVVGSLSSGCASTNTAVANVTVSLPPTLTVNSGSVCTGGTFTIIPNGASTYTFSGGVSVVSPTINTTYTVTGTNAFGCVGTPVVSSVTVSSGPTLSISSSPNVSCLGNTTTLTASGASSYSWSTGATTSTISINPSSNTIYSVIGTISGCSSTKTISVNPIDIVLSSTVTNIACNVSVNSGSISLLPGGGTFPYYYSWSNGATTANIKNLAVGGYSVLVSDANGCVDSLQLNVTRPTSLTVSTSIVNPACGASDGQISSTVSGGTSPYTYIWNSGATTPVASSLTPGQYIVQVYDASNCYGSAIVNLNPTNGPVVTIGTTNNVTCYGGNNGSTSINVNGGQAPVTTQWSNGATSNTISGLSAGVYDVIVTDGSGCKVNESIIINQPSGLNVQPVVTRPNCAQSNGAISLNISGGQAPFTYTWSANASNASTQNVSGIASGYYNVIIGYNNGCTQTIGIGVSDLTNLAVNVVTVSPSSCTSPTGSIDVTAVNGVPSYTFSWSNGATTEDIANVFPGNYFVTVTDADLCKTSTSVFVPSNIYDYQPEICLISVDTSNNTNYIVWQKNITYGVEKYKIYRESSVPNNFQFVADVPFSALSEYTDLVANADVHSWRYRLSSVDSCGNEIPSYIDHKTIYLDVTFGATTNDLTWNYYAGFSYNKFYISRYDITNGWQLYDSVPGNIYTYTDITPPSTGDVRYLVEAKAPFNCIPQLKMAAQTSNKTKSNVKHNDFSVLPTRLEDILNSYFFIAPNPAKDEVFVNFSSTIDVATKIQITDVLGKRIAEYTVYDGKKLTIPLDGFRAGLYFIQVQTGKSSVVKKFVKE